MPSSISLYTPYEKEVESIDLSVACNDLYCTGLWTARLASFFSDNAGACRILDSNHYHNLLTDLARRYPAAMVSPRPYSTGEHSCGKLYPCGGDRLFGSVWTSLGASFEYFLGAARAAIMGDEPASCIGLCLFDVRGWPHLGMDYRP